MKATIRSDFQRRVRWIVPSIDDNEDPSHNKTEYSHGRTGTPSPIRRRDVERKSLAQQGIRWSSPGSARLNTPPRPRRAVRWIRVRPNI
ncbi:hypothetical protein [Micromonospora cremea]|uniref:hypothetical protein n=1 Tax=Micromonospora cremea TaxID=709881 RepID=UPI00117CA9B7|nr:hypothetical protein [Micromonospora cremea]